jgi:phospholipase C
MSTMGRYGVNHTLSLKTFLAKAAAGELPQVSFVDADFSVDAVQGDDEHPPGEIEIGQHFVWEVTNALLTGPSWSTTALFITYDENGGEFDHVPPPGACLPDGDAPKWGDSFDKSQGGTFDRYGFRVPFVVVSPYAKKSYVSHEVYSHASITRFIETRFTLPALSARDANAESFSDLFDWDNPPFMVAPTFTEPTIDQAAVAACVAALTPK